MDESPSVQTVRDCALICVANLGLYLVAAWIYPVVYGGDTIIRIVNYPRILISYQLPLFQFLVHLAMRWFYGAYGIWTLMGLVAGLAASGIYALARQLFDDRRTGWYAAVFFACHPFIFYYSRVPYQEPLLMAGIAWGFYFLFRGSSSRHIVLSSAAFGAACLTRYEGWIAAAVAAATYLGFRTNRFSLKHLVQAAAFGWAPLAWLLWNRRISPAGTFVLERDWSWAHFHRPYFIAKSAVWWTTPAVLLVVAAGLVLSCRESGSGGRRLPHVTLMAFLLLFLLALVFSGHGINPDPERMVTEREAYVPIGWMMLYGGRGAWAIAEIVGHKLRSFSLLRSALPLSILVLIALLSARRGVERVAAANQDPDLQTDYQVATFLVERRARAVILARPLPDEQIDQYLRRAARLEGEDGLRRAREVLRQVETTPFDYQRVLAFSWLGRERVLAGDRLRGYGRDSIKSLLKEREIDFLVVFSDFLPVSDHEHAILSLYGEGHSPVKEIKQGNKGARIYRVREGNTAPQ